MVEGTAVAGASFGVAVSVFANSIRRLPLSRLPYNHLAWGAAGWFFLPWYDKQVEVARVQVIEKQKDRMEKNITF